MAIHDGDSEVEARWRELKREADSRYHLPLTLSRCEVCLWNYATR